MNLLVKYFILQNLMSTPEQELNVFFSNYGQNTVNQIMSMIANLFFSEKNYRYLLYGKCGNEGKTSIVILIEKLRELLDLSPRTINCQKHFRLTFNKSVTETNLEVELIKFLGDSFNSRVIFFEPLVVPNPHLDLDKLFCKDNLVLLIRSVMARLNTNNSV